MAEVLIILAHPQLQRSRVNRAMIEAVAMLPHVRVHDLYERYPDYFIDLAEEKQGLLHARHIIFQHPMQWYGCPSLLKEWIDIVLQRGWAYGEGGTALRGKSWISAVSAGGSDDMYQTQGLHRHPLTDFLKPFEQTASFCGMSWQEPFVLYDALAASDEQIQTHAARYRALVRKLTAEV